MGFGRYTLDTTSVMYILQSDSNAISYVGHIECERNVVILESKAPLLLLECLCDIIIRTKITDSVHF